MEPTGHNLANILPLKAAAFGQLFAQHKQNYKANMYENDLPPTPSLYVCTLPLSGSALISI